MMTSGIPGAMFLVTTTRPKQETYAQILLMHQDSPDGECLLFLLPHGSIVSFRAIFLDLWLLAVCEYGIVSFFASSNSVRNIIPPPCLHKKDDQESKHHMHNMLQCSIY